MALVAYDNSDSSEYEEDDNESAPVVTLKKKVDTEEVTKEIIISEPEQNGSVDNSSLFIQLPQPSTMKLTVIEEDDEFLHKKEKPEVVKSKAKITVPSLSDFKDVEDTPTPKPKITTGKKSGLLSILPQPKNAVTAKTTSLVPQQLKKPATTTKTKKELLPPVKKSKVTSTIIGSYSDESDNDDEVQNDFFSINKPIDLPDEDIPLDIDKPEHLPVPSQKKPVGIEAFFKKDVPSHVELQPDYDGLSIENSNLDSGNSTEYDNVEGRSSYGNGTVENSNNSEVLLDEEAIRQLCGARGKRKREEIQIVDVNQQEVLADARELLLRGLMDDTTKRVSSSKKKGNEPTSQQRRKHQITYLAHQAKANEADLQNQWAQNRMSRRQTQSKYGF